MKKLVMDKYNIDLSRQVDGSYLAECSDVQGVYAEGKTYMDALLNIEDVLRIALELTGAESSSPKTEKFRIELPNPLRFGITA